ncbi:MAG: hypothetical protein GXO48_08640 [Chlorobi bacterium]|nr:hypothetical protein [Chlorobiota bacterium]
MNGLKSLMGTLLAICSIVATAQTVSTQLDSVISYTVNSTLNQWEYYSKLRDYSYDSDGNITGYTVQMWNGTTWNNQRKIQYTYSNGELIEYFEQVWVGGSWQNSWRTIRTYNTQGLLTETKSERWTQQRWVPVTRRTYAYNSVDSLTEEVYQVWDTLTSQWVNSSRKIMTYIASALRDATEFFLWDMMTSSWRPDRKELYSYDPDGNMIERIDKRWNTTLSAYENIRRETYSFNANGVLIEQIKYQWDGGSWRPSQRYSVTLNPNNTVDTKLWETWNVGTSQWENNLRELYSYTSGNLSSLLSQIWDATSSTWQNTSRVLYGFTNSGKPLYEHRFSWDNVQSKWKDVELKEFTYDSYDREVRFHILNWDDASGEWRKNYRRDQFYASVTGIEGSLTSRFKVSIVHHVMVIEGDHEAVSITDSKGRTFVPVQLGNGMYDLLSLPAGVYVVTITGREESINIKIAITK